HRDGSTPAALVGGLLDFDSTADSRLDLGQDAWGQLVERVTWHADRHSRACANVTGQRRDEFQEEVLDPTHLPAIQDKVSVFRCQTDHTDRGLPRVEVTGWVRRR